MILASILEATIAILSYELWIWRKQPVYFVMSAMAAGWTLIFLVLAVLR